MLGIWERLGMGMTWEQAIDRSFRSEKRRIDEIHSAMRNAVYLARRRIENIKKEVEV